MPDLDLQQVNYDIDVVDEILGQVVEQMHEISSTWDTKIFTDLDLPV